MCGKVLTRPVLRIKTGNAFHTSVDMPKIRFVRCVSWTSPQELDRPWRLLYIFIIFIQLVRWQEWGILYSSGVSRIPPWTFNTDKLFGNATKKYVPFRKMTSSNRNIFRATGPPHKGQWRRALMFSSICAWTNGQANNRDAGYLRRHRAHYDLIVMVNVIRNGQEKYSYDYLYTLWPAAM